MYMRSLLQRRGISLPPDRTPTTNHNWTPKVCKIMEKQMETTRFRGYVGFRVLGLGPQKYVK